MTIKEVGQEYPWLKVGADIGEVYGPAIELAKSGNSADQGRYLEALIHYTIHTNPDLSAAYAEPGGGQIVWDSAKETVLSSIGYFAGYFEAGTIELVYKVYKAIHPVFGFTTPTDSVEVFNLGLKLGSKLAREREEKEKDIPNGRS